MLVGDHEALAEVRQRVGVVEPHRVAARQSHAVTAFHSGFAGSRWPKWSSSGSTISDAPEARAKRSLISTGTMSSQAAVREQRRDAEREPLDRRGDAASAAP